MWNGGVVGTSCCRSSLPSHCVLFSARSQRRSGGRRVVGGQRRCMGRAGSLESTVTCVEPGPAPRCRVSTSALIFPRRRAPRVVELHDGAAAENAPRIEQAFPLLSTVKVWVAVAVDDGAEAPGERGNPSAASRGLRLRVKALAAAQRRSRTRRNDSLQSSIHSRPRPPFVVLEPKTRLWRVSIVVCILDCARGPGQGEN